MFFQKAACPRPQRQRHQFCSQLLLSRGAPVLALYLTMINQILASARRSSLLPLRSMLSWPLSRFFSSGSGGRKDEKEESVISLGKEEIDRMRAMLDRRDGLVVEGEGEGEEFFQGEEVRLSLKLLQVDSLEQLKPFLQEYSNKQPEAEEKAAELARCKFFILLKHINLEGSLLSKEVAALFRDVAASLKHLDEDILTVFLRLVANDPKAKQAFRKLAPKVVLHAHPSHSNSELLSLLLMVYPEAKEEIYVHYHLLPSRLVEEKPQRMIYDPLNLVHILSHFFYYDDVHCLFEATLRTASVEEADALPEEFIRTDSDFRRRKAEALIYAVSHELYEIYSKYLTKEYLDFGLLDFTQSVQLLRSLVLSDKASGCQDGALTECARQLIGNLVAKSEEFMGDEQAQERENESYKDVSEIIASYMRKKQAFLPRLEMQALIASVFGPATRWRVRFDSLPAEHLFAVIVSYKASKDFLRATQSDLDPEGNLFASMLSAFRHAAAEADPKQVFYVCLFAQQLNALPFLGGTTVLEGLKEFGAREGLSETARRQLGQIMEELSRLK